MFHEVLFPENISEGATGGPKFKTTIFTSDAGYEQRNIDWELPKAEYDVSHGVRKQEHMDELTSFFMARLGRKHSFRFKDWNDYRLDGQVYVSDGTTTVQLEKRYTTAQAESGESYTFVRPIYKPVWGSFRNITVAGVAVVEDTDFTIDYTKGIITFTEAPTSGDEIVIGKGQFHVPVRFDTDHFDPKHEGYLAGSWESIPLIEDRNVLVS